MADPTALPKAHLHVHLESTVRWSTLRELAVKNGVQVPEGLAGTPVFRGFRDFADQNALIRACLRRREDFVRIAREFCADEAAQGTRYAEVTFTAASHGDRLGEPETPLDGVLEGLAKGRAEHGIECRVVLDHSRRRPVDRLRWTVEVALRHPEVVAVGLAGDEAYPLAPFVSVLREAKDAGLRLVHHAGESAGAGSVREAVEAGFADRLGHGIRVLEDPDVVALVRERGIPLEVCPSSNVALGFVASLAEHPLPRLAGAGLRVTLNTDVPSVLGVSLSDEYAKVRDAFGYGDDVLAGFARASVTASFAPETTKALMRQGIDAWLTA